MPRDGWYKQFPMSDNVEYGNLSREDVVADPVLEELILQRMGDVNDPVAALIRQTEIENSPLARQAGMDQLREMFYRQIGARR